MVIKNKTGQGWPAGSVGGTYSSWSPGPEFELHVACRVYLKINK